MNYSTAHPCCKLALNIHMLLCIFKVGLVQSSSAVNFYYHLVVVHGNGGIPAVEFTLAQFSEGQIGSPCVARGVGNGRHDPRGHLLYDGSERRFFCVVSSFLYACASCDSAPPPLPAGFGIFKVGLVQYGSYFKFLLRVGRDVDKAEIGCAVAFIIVQSYAEELEMDILERR